MKIVSIVGARPQFVKAALLSRELRQHGHREILVHTGQHYDENMSDVFFRELDIPTPEVNLGVGSGSHGAQTGAMLTRIENVLLTEKPDWMVVYGDTNSTLAGALAGAKLHIRLAHVEAGLRSYNRAMPEEINRVVVDHLADLLLCPSRAAVANLAAEGITRGVHLVGDVMADALAIATKRLSTRTDVVERLGLNPGKYLLMTLHRAENTDNVDRLRAILSTLAETDEPLVFPVHPRTRKRIADLDDGMQEKISKSGYRMVDPLGYFEMVMLERSARMILTDSGGMQKEAYWLGKPCVTLRDETEWLETVDVGWNVLVGADPDRIRNAISSFRPPQEHPVLYGDGNAAARIARLLSALGDEEVRREVPEHVYGIT